MRCYIYPNRELDAGWTNIRLQKRGCASDDYCPKFSEVRASSTKFKAEVHREKCKDKNHQKIGIKYL